MPVTSISMLSDTSLLLQTSRPLPSRMQSVALCPRPSMRTVELAGLGVMDTAEKSTSSIPTFSAKLAVRLTLEVRANDKTESCSPLLLYNNSKAKIRKKIDSQEKK